MPVTVVVPSDSRHTPHTKEPRTFLEEVIADKVLDKLGRMSQSQISVFGQRRTEGITSGRSMQPVGSTILVAVPYKED